MALPTSRNRTYAAASPVIAADLNAIQDCIIGAKHGAKTMIIPGTSFKQKNTGAAVVYDNSPTLLTSGAAAADTIASFEIPVGSSITAVRFYVRDNVTGATKWTCDLGKSTLYDAAVNSLVTPSVSAGTGVDQTLTPVPASLPHTVLGGGVRYALSAKMTTGTATCKLYGAEVDYTTP